MGCQLSTCKLVENKWTINQMQVKEMSQILSPIIEDSLSKGRNSKQISERIINESMDLSLIMDNNRDNSQIKEQLSTQLSINNKYKKQEIQNNEKEQFIKLLTNFIEKQLPLIVQAEKKHQMSRQQINNLKVQSIILMITSKILPKINVSSEEIKGKIQSGILLSRKQRIIASFIRKTKSEIQMEPIEPVIQVGNQVQKQIKIKLHKPIIFELEWNQKKANASKYSIDGNKIERIDEDTLFYQLVSRDPLFTNTSQRILIKYTKITGNIVLGIILKSRLDKCYSGDIFDKKSIGYWSNNLKSGCTCIDGNWINQWTEDYGTAEGGQIQMIIDLLNWKLNFIRIANEMQQEKNIEIDLPAHFNQEEIYIFVVTDTKGSKIEIL